MVGPRFRAKPGANAESVMRRRPLRTKISRPSTTLPPDIVTSPSFANAPVLIGLLSVTSPGEATLTKLTIPPGARTRGTNAEFGGGDPLAGGAIFSAPPTNEMVSPVGTWSRLVNCLAAGLGLETFKTPVCTLIGAGVAVRKPKAAGGATVNNASAPEGTALKRL